MHCLWWERVMCERKAKKDAPATVVSRAACVSRAPLADASRLARSRPAWSLRVNLLSTIQFHWSGGFWFLVCKAATQLATQVQQRRIQVVRSNNVARKRLTNQTALPQWTYEYFLI